MKITANEIFVRESGTYIRTRCEKQYVTDDMVCMWAQHSKLDVGDTIIVQCMNHERDMVIWQRRYLVAQRRDFLRRTENLTGDVRHEEAFEVRLYPETDWWEVTRQSISPGDFVAGEVAWNVGARSHDVKVGGRVVCSHPDKDVATAIADGKLPIPEMEAA